MDIKDIVAGKKYINKNGEEKTLWVNIGQLFIKDDGKMTVKMNDYINPCAFRNDKGEVWFNVFDKKPRENNQYSTSSPSYSSLPLPDDNNRSQVVAEGRAYAEKYRKMAEEKAAAQQPSDEEWFKEHQEIVDALVD